MGSILVTVILFVLLFVGIGIANQVMASRKPVKKPGFLCKAQLFSLLAFLLMIPSFVTVVPANSVGVVYSAISGTKKTTLSEGYHMKSPIDAVYDISTEVKTVTVEGLTTQTKDSQFVTSKLDVKYRVNEGNAYIVFKQFKTLDNMQNQLIISTTQRVLEQITTQYNVMDILGSKRSEIYEALENALKAEFEESGVDFYSISITDMDAGDELEKAITAEAVAKKAVETAKQELEKAKTEAQKQVVEAQAQQDAAKIAAETTVIKAKAEADSNKLLNNSLTELIIQKMYIDKWDGVMPKVSASSGSGLIFDVSGLTAE